MKLRAAYTLIEVLAAGAILAIAATATAALALATVTQEQVNARVMRCVNLHEQAARLYHLGLEPSAITAILPPTSGVSLSFSTPATVTDAGLGTVEQTVSTLTFTSAPLATESSVPDAWRGGDDSATRTQQFLLVRPTIR